MSYIDFDHLNNRILICKGDSRNRQKIELKNTFKGFSEFHFENEFNGIEIKDFLSNLEQDGLKGEMKFKELLEDNNIPYLYIGQGPFGIERSGVLIEKTKSKRADFLVNIKDMGTILFDAKCRNKIGFQKSDEKYFSLFISEIDALNNLQSSILMPVWLAFTERNLLDKNEKSVFYFISISTIIKFKDELAKKFKIREDFTEISVLRIPNVLLTKIVDKIIFEVGYRNIDDEILQEFMEKNLGFFRIVKDKIKEIIRKKECYKSNIYTELQAEKIDYCFPFEVNKCIEKLIADEVINYKPKQYLKLIGE